MKKAFKTDDVLVVKQIAENGNEAIGGRFMHSQGLCVGDLAIVVVADTDGTSIIASENCKYQLWQDNCNFKKIGTL
jgi:hypothetical protein